MALALDAFHKFQSYHSGSLLLRGGGGRDVLLSPTISVHEGRITNVVTRKSCHSETNPRRLIE